MSGSGGAVGGCAIGADANGADGCGGGIGCCAAALAAASAMDRWNSASCAWLEVGVVGAVRLADDAAGVLGADGAARPEEADDPDVAVTGLDGAPTRGGAGGLEPPLIGGAIGAEGAPVAGGPDGCGEVPDPVGSLGIELSGFTDGAGGALLPGDSASSPTMGSIGSGGPSAGGAGGPSGMGDSRNPSMGTRLPAGLARKRSSVSSVLPWSISVSCLAGPSPSLSSPTIGAIVPAACMTVDLFCLRIAAIPSSMARVFASSGRSSRPLTQSRI